MCQGLCPDRNERRGPAVSRCGHTYTVVRHATHYAFAGQIPYVLAIVELAEGPRLVTALTGVGIEPGEVRVGLPVRVVFREVADGVTLPYFEPTVGGEAKDGGPLDTL